MRKIAVTVSVLLLAAAQLLAFKLSAIDVGLGINSEVSAVFRQDDWELTAGLKTDGPACALGYPFTLGLSAEARYNLVNTDKNTFGVGLGATSDFVVDSNFSPLFSADLTLAFRHYFTQKTAFLFKTAFSLAGYSWEDTIIFMRAPLYSLQDLVVRHTAIGISFAI